MELVFCPKCQQSKPREAFSKNRSTTNGLQTWCKSCHAARQAANKAKQTAYAKKWRDTHPEASRAATARYLLKNPRTPAMVSKVNAAYRKRHPDRVAANHLRRYARKKQAPIIDKIDRPVIYARDRWICQICLEKVNPKGKKGEAPSIDHVIPIEEGGEESYKNCVLAHLRCNSKKKHLHNIPQQQRLFG